MSSKRYRLKKDLPDGSKAGTVYYLNGNSYYKCRKPDGSLFELSDGKGMAVFHSYVEGNPEWFEEIKEEPRRGEMEIGKCGMCQKENVPVSREYYRYGIKCECHSPNHFEIVFYCKNCTPKPPSKTTISIKPIKEEPKEEWVWTDKLVGAYANYVHDNIAPGQAVWPFNKKFQYVDKDLNLHESDEPVSATIKLTPESFQPTKEDNKEWEIVAFYDGCINGRVDKRCLIECKKNMEEKAVLLGFTIHSVKRLSDGVVFSVGDEVEVNHVMLLGKYVKIDSFFISGNDIIASASGESWNLSWLSKKIYDLSHTQFKEDHPQPSNTNKVDDFFDGKQYSLKDVLEAEEKAFNAGRIDIGDSNYPMFKFKTFSDYKNSKQQ